MVSASVRSGQIYSHMASVAMVLVQGRPVSVCVGTYRYHTGKVLVRHTIYLHSLVVEKCR